MKTKKLLSLFCAAVLTASQLNPAASFSAYAADSSLLSYYINKAETYSDDDEAFYPADSYDKFKSALSEAKSIYSSQESTEEQISSSVTALKSAINSLHGNLLTSKVLTDNAFSDIDLNFYKSYGINLEKISTGAVYTWTEDSSPEIFKSEQFITDAEGNQLGSDLQDGNVTNGSGEYTVNSAWSSGLQTSAIVYDLKDNYYIDRIDVVSRYNSGNQLGDITVKIGTDPDNLLEVCTKAVDIPGSDTISNSFLPFGFSFEPTYGRYVSVTFTNAKKTYTGGTSYQYCLGEVILFGGTSPVNTKAADLYINKAESVIKQSALYSEESIQNLNASLKTAKSSLSKSQSILNSATVNLFNSLKNLSYNEPLMVLSDNNIHPSDTEYYKNNMDIELIPYTTGAEYSWTKDSNADIVKTDTNSAEMTGGLFTNPSGGFNANSSWGTSAFPSTAIFDLKNTYYISRVDIFSRISAQNQLGDIVIKAGDSPDNLKTIAESSGAIPDVVTSGSFYPTSVNFDMIPARYVSVTMNNAKKTYTGGASYQYCLGEIVIFGRNVVAEGDRLEKAVAAGEKYINNMAYDQNSMEKLQNAVSNAQNALLDNNISYEDAAAYEKSVYEAINSLNIKGGEKILTQNTMWESDWNLYNDKNIIRELLPNASHAFTNDSDEQIFSQGSQRLFGGGSSNSAGDYCLFSQWDNKAKSSSLIYDFGEECYVSGVDLMSRFVYTDKSKYLVGNYTVEISTDGENYKQIGVKDVRTNLNENESPTDGNGYPLFTEYTFPAEKARFVKVTFNKALGAYMYILHELYIRGRKSDSNEIILTKTNSGVNASLTLDGNEQTAQLVIAVYNKDGRLKKVKNSDCIELNDGKTIITCDTDVAIGEYAKAMALESISALTPITETRTLRKFSNAEFSAADIFGSGSVLQRDTRLPVWGSAPTGTKVIVTLDNKEYSSIADENGRWEVTTDEISLSDTPYTLTISDGSNIIEYTDILAGDVWLCSGQSNMYWKLKWCDNSTENIASANNYPNIKYFQTPIVGSETPLDTTAGKWQTVSSKNAGELSAVAFLTARNLNNTLNVPIGIIEAARGATSIEGFISREGFKNSNVERYWTNLDRSLYYNGMINPVIPYSIKGVLWYQGCQNQAPNASVYLDEEIALLNDWRSRWGYDFPFIVTQLAACSGYSGFPEIREKQLALRDVAPNAAVAVIMDAIPSTPDNIHPTNKQPVADRLSLCAQALAYGMDVQYRFPVPANFEINSDGSVTITYADVYDGLKIPNGANKVTGFKLVQDGTDYNASAEIISANTVRVSAEGVTAPTAIKYGYEDYPAETLNLYNSADLIASPFKSELK